MSSSASSVQFSVVRQLAAECHLMSGDTFLSFKLVFLRLCPLCSPTHAFTGVSECSPPAGLPVIAVTFTRGHSCLICVRHLCKAAWLHLKSTFIGPCDWRREWAKAGGGGVLQVSFLLNAFNSPYWVSNMIAGHIWINFSSRGSGSHHPYRADWRRKELGLDNGGALGLFGCCCCHMEYKALAVL